MISKNTVKKYKTDLAGGDTTTSLTGLTIGMTAIGHVKKEFLVKRNGAKPNDLICVTGDFGASYMGLQLLERERRLFEKEKVIRPDFTGYEYIIGRELKPELPVQILNKLAENKIIISSMTDISDGLAPSLQTLCHASSKGCRIYYEKIPIDAETAKTAEEFEMDPVTGVLSGGDDFEFLFTVPVGSFGEVEKIPGISIIGHMTAETGVCTLVLPNHQEVSITSRGWGEPE